MLTRRFFSVLFILNVSFVMCLARKRIYGGWNADIRDFPWHVSLFDNEALRCAGSIITQKHVLTAAHCLYGKTDLRPLSIEYGTNRLGKGFGITLPVVNWAIPSDFRDKQLDHDVGVVTVDAPGFLFSPSAQPVKLRTFAATATETVAVTGLGITQTGGKFSPILQVTLFNIIDWNTCSIIPSILGKLSPNMVCATAVGRATCRGDSGGPVYGLHSQVAIVSWGPLDINGKKICEPGNPGIFTNIVKYRNFIDQKTQYSVQWSNI